MASEQELAMLDMLDVYKVAQKWKPYLLKHLSNDGEDAVQDLFLEILKQKTRGVIRGEMACYAGAIARRMAASRGMMRRGVKRRHHNDHGKLQPFVHVELDLNASYQKKDGDVEDLENAEAAIITREEDAKTAAAKLERRTFLNSMLREASDRDREIITRVLNGQSEEEILEAMHLTHKQYGNLNNRAKARLIDKARKRYKYLCLKGQTSNTGT